MHPPVTSDNIAYDSVQNLKENHRNPVKDTSQDYENIGEVYFKRGDNTEGVYESVADQTRL